MVLAEYAELVRQQDAAKAAAESTPPPPIPQAAGERDPFACYMRRVGAEEST